VSLTAVFISLSTQVSELTYSNNPLKGVTMLKFFLAFCFALAPMLLASGTTANVRSPSGYKNLVAFTGNRSHSISQAKSDILDTHLTIVLSGIKGISLVPQTIIEELKLEYEETALVSIGKALELLKADREICYFVTENTYGYKIDFYIFDGSNGDTLFLKNETAGNIIDCIVLLSDYLLEAEPILKGKTETPELKPQARTAPANTEKGAATAKTSKKQYNAPYAPDRLNIELGAYDFINRTQGGPFVRYHSSFIALNYKIFSPLKDLVFIFGPFYSEGLGNNDAGVRVSGYFNRYPKEIYNIYTGLSASGGYCNKNAAFFAEGEAKLGGELSLWDIDLFVEGGAAIRTNQDVNLVVNMGARFYLF